MISIDFRSLIPFGMTSTDDEDLRWYFSYTKCLAEDLDSTRAAKIERILDHLLFSYEGSFRHFYAPVDEEYWQFSKLKPLMAKGFGSDAAMDHFINQHALTAPPPGDGDARLEWIKESGQGTTYFKWLLRLDSGSRLSQLEDRARMDIEESSRTSLERLVESYDQSKQFLDMLDERARREQERKEWERRIGSQPSVNGSPRMTRRKYGELPPEPHVIKRTKLTYST